MVNPSRAPNLPALTGLRFFAALAVLDVHFGRWLPPTGPLHTLVGRGSFAVSLFFVLSGFILAYTYATPDSTLRGTAGAFYRARFARIYPVYLTGLLLALATPDPFYPNTPRALALLPTLALVQSWLPSLVQAINGPGWSLSAEAFFYALFPLLLRTCLRMGTRQRIGLIAVLWLGSALVQHQAALVGAGETLDILPLARLPEFLIGILACGIWSARRRHEWGARRCDLVAVSSIGSALLVLGYAPDAWNQVLLTGGLAPLWALLLYALATGRGTITRTLGCRPLATLGAASYSLYILHWPLWCALAAFSGTPSWTLLHVPWFFGMYMLIAIACSVLAHRYVEEPGRRALRGTHRARPRALPAPVREDRAAIP